MSWEEIEKLVSLIRDYPADRDGRAAGEFDNAREKIDGPENSRENFRELSA